MSEDAIEVRIPKQRRSRESYARVLEAAHALLEENGFEGFTVQEVAARAGVSVGAIYERFGNKELLLRAVHAELMEQFARDEARRSAERPEPEGVEQAIAAAVARVGYTMNRHRKELRAFMHLGAMDEVISSRGSESSVALSREFKRALGPYRDQFSHPKPDVALDVAFRMAFSTLARQVMYGPVFESSRRMSWDRLANEVAAACAAYLLHYQPL